VDKALSTQGRDENAYKILIGKLEGTKPADAFRLEDAIKRDPKEHDGGL
jgi:hypothetical protein